MSKIARAATDNSLIARRLGSSQRILCAAPDYLAAHGSPQCLDDLSAHSCLLRTGTTHWTFHTHGTERRIRVGGRFSSSSMDGILDACIQGGGIAFAAIWNVETELRDGRLIQLSMTDMDADDMSIWAVFPSTRHVLPKVRVFMTALEQTLSR